MIARRVVAAPILAAALALVAATPGLAQESRAEVIREQQEAKRSVLEPPSRNRGEVIIDRLERWGLFSGKPPRGVYPWLGSVFPGGGLGGGAGVRTPVGDDGAFDVFGGYTINGFARVEANLALSSFASDRGRITLTGRYVDAPDVKYYGVGNDSHKDDRTTFGYTPTTGAARVEFDAGRFVTLGGGVTYLHIDTARGRTAPSIEERFSPADTPGLAFGSSRYVNSSVNATFDWRRPAGYSGSGGLYRVQFDDYRADESERSFRSLEAEVRQLIPLLRANWVLALRGLTTITDVDAAGDVPFFLLPSLGGGTLRGYPDFRFRDRHRLLMGAELRWTPARFLDMALFYDAGKVAARRQDLDFDGLKDSYGIGMRLVGPNGYAFRVEVARSREHSARLIVGGGGTF